MALRYSYMPNYYSIEDILVTQDRVPCTFLETALDLGKLDSSSEGKDLAAGAELELPLWLVQAVSIGRQAVVRPSLPKIYQEAYREILKADPTAVNLHKFSLNFFELGRYVRSFDQHRVAVRDCLEQTFQRRFRHLMDLSETTFVDPNLIDKLDLMERRLFQDGHQARLKLNTWLAESVLPIQAAEMVASHRKRKRVEIESYK